MHPGPGVLAVERPRALLVLSEPGGGYLEGGRKYVPYKAMLYNSDGGDTRGDKLARLFTVFACDIFQSDGECVCVVPLTVLSGVFLVEGLPWTRQEYVPTYILKERDESPPRVGAWKAQRGQMLMFGGMYDVE